LLALLLSKAVWKIIWSSWRLKARQLKVEVYALYFAVRDPRVPWYAKLFAACVVAYALSPIDLIPDFIPILGYLDDLILLPLGIALALKMIPPIVLAECREKGRFFHEKPKSWVGAAVIVSIWILFSVILVCNRQTLLLGLDTTCPSPGAASPAFTKTQSLTRAAAGA
jgi:uncharacterized membrane protein YkvA (DUF1232 family)